MKPDIFRVRKAPARKQPVVHTPGPWIVDGGCIEAPETNRIIGSVVTGSDQGIHRVGSKKEQLANAKLVAASPDLLAALKALIDSPNAKQNELWDSARAAVAKAVR